MVALSRGGLGWVFGLRDRLWPERPIFGEVHSMTAPAFGARPQSTNMSEK
jgi:hypothetical protein